MVKTTNITIILNTPLYLTLIFYAEPIVTMAFSTAWSQSIDILRILAIWGIMRTCLNPPGTLLLALNKTKTLRYWNLFVLAATALTVLLATPYGATLTAASLTALTITQVILVWPALLRNNTTINIREYFVEIISPIIIGVLSIGFISLTSPFDTSNPSTLAAQITISITIYLGMCTSSIKRSLTLLSKKPT
jgi:O-antigen/teichoic acid export membrane protein